MKLSTENSFLNLKIKGKDRSDVAKLVECPAGQDELVWQYEHIRQFIVELNLLTVQVGKECNSETCGQMKVGKEQYLCAFHTPNSEVSILPHIFRFIH